VEVARTQRSEKHEPSNHLPTARPDAMAGSEAYGGQDRGNAAAYDTYYAAMDSTMRQKLAFVGAHFLLDPGSRIADMGCGSGYGTYQLALLNPHVKELLDKPLISFINLR
jgi:hypothetical protein